jgi:signal transduction histidine kinase/Tfp pilus assembly protein PilF
LTRQKKVGYCKLFHIFVNKTVKIKAFLFLAIPVLLHNFSLGQVDDLISSLPSLKGEKKVITLCDISYFYSNTDPVKGMRYGRLALIEAKKQKNDKLILQALNDMSISYLNASSYDTVLILANQAVHISDKIKDNLSKAKAYNRIAMVYFERGLHKESIDYNFKALKIFEEQNQIAYQGLILTNIGSSFEKLGLFEDAIKNHLKVLEIAQKTNSAEMYSSSYGNLGIVYMKKGNYSLADQYYEKAIQYIDANQDKKRLSIIYQNIGVNARSMGNSEKGIRYYKKSLDLYHETNDSLGLGLIYFNLANCLQDVGKLKDAQSYIDSGLVIGKKINALPLIRDAYRALFRQASLQGDYILADSYFEQYEKYRDSILNIEKVKAVSEIQTKYNLQAKEKQILQEKALNEENKKRFYATGGIALSLAFLLLLVWQRQKLRLRKKEVETLNRLTDERNRIARDLHDNLGAELTIVSSKLDTKIYKTEKELEKEELEKIADLTRNASTVLRETVWSIKAEKLTLLSLTEKIKEFFHRLEKEESFSLNISIQEEQKEFTPLLALNLFRISQEALTNVLKYASATSVEMQITPNSLIIQDDGQGFDINSIKKGYGLKNMESRVAEFNGTFSVSSSNKGTKISVTFES